MNYKKETIGDCELYLGDSADVIPELEGGAFIDALITDPPYASGGLSIAARTKGTVKKYTNKSGVSLTLPEFAGDALDQRCWGKMLTGILRAADSKLKGEAIYCFFIDWRQIAALMDALMLEGYTPRGVAVWNKLLSRPLPNGFAQTAEFIVWGRKRSVSRKGDKIYLPGVFTVENEMNRPGVGNGRFHVTQKPLQLMKQLLMITRPGDIVLDPFMGSGTTGVACVQMGRRFIGIEKEARYFEIACNRIRDAANQGELMTPAYSRTYGTGLSPPPEFFYPAELEEEEL
jgi:site-specific DNA-methyltransferase (adenine-specific)